MIDPYHFPVASAPRATQASAIASVARGPQIWTPKISSYSSAATIFTNPAVSPRILALPIAEKGNLEVLTV